MTPVRASKTFTYAHTHKGGAVMSHGPVIARRRIVGRLLFPSGFECISFLCTPSRYPLRPLARDPVYTYGKAVLGIL